MKKIWKHLFNQNMLYILLMLVQIAFLVLSVLFLNRNYAWVYGALLLLNALCSSVIHVSERRVYRTLRPREDRIAPTRLEMSSVRSFSLMPLWCVPGSLPPCPGSMSTVFTPRRNGLPLGCFCLLALLAAEGDCRFSLGESVAR